jgi:predicted AAA+ superfamily ATPase
LKETVTLDNLNVLEALHEDAYQYIKNLKRPSAIDEIQRFPKIVLVLKQIMDEEKQQGLPKRQFILTGSANIFTINDLKKSKNWGIIFETWVYSELRKLCAYESGTRIYFYGTQDGQEVNFIIQKGQQILAVVRAVPISTLF